jgi:hypothetical protein
MLKPLLHILSSEPITMLIIFGMALYFMATGVR